MTRPRISHTTVVAYLALVIAMSGTAWAVTANSVGTKELKRGAVHTSDIAGGAVTKAKLKKPYNNRVEYAQVRKDGVLIAGTAASATRATADSGLYYFEFPRPIDKCAATANAGAFPGYSLALNHITANISIAYGQGGLNNRAVTVQLHDSTLAGADSSFMLVLACP